VPWCLSSLANPVRRKGCFALRDGYGCGPLVSVTIGEKLRGAQWVGEQRILRSSTSSALPMTVMMAPGADSIFQAG